MSWMHLMFSRQILQDGRFKVDAILLSKTSVRQMPGAYTLYSTESCCHEASNNIVHVPCVQAVQIKINIIYHKIFKRIPQNFLTNAK